MALPRLLDIGARMKSITSDEVSAANNSQVSLSQLVSLREGGQLTNSTDVGVNLRLPNFEKRWQA